MNTHENITMLKNVWQAAELSRLLGVEPMQQVRNDLNQYAQQFFKEFTAALTAARAVRADEGEAPWSLGIRMVGAALEWAEKNL